MPLVCMNLCTYTLTVLHNATMLKVSITLIIPTSFVLCAFDDLYCIIQLFATHTDICGLSASF